MAQLAEIKSAYESLKENHHKLEKLEETLKSTLVDAKQTANNIIDTAKSDAQRIITEARDRARQVHARELDSAGRIKEQIERLTGIRDSYRRRVEEQIKNHLTLISELEQVQPDAQAAPIFEELSETADLSEYLHAQDEASETAPVDPADPADTVDSVDSVDTVSEETTGGATQASVDENREKVENSTSSVKSHDTDSSEPETARSAPVDEGVRAEFLELAENAAGEPHPHSKTQYERRFVEDIVEVKEVPPGERRPVSVQIAQAADRAISKGKLEERTNAPQTREVDEELYKKLRKTDELASPEAPVQSSQRQKPTGSAGAANTDPTRDLRGEDGIIVFGRREDRERAVEENAKVLSDLDTVVDKFAEELSKIEKS